MHTSKAGAWALALWVVIAVITPSFVVHHNVVTCGLPWQHEVACGLGCAIFMSVVVLILHCAATDDVDVHV
jgi:uncharacterized membrane protein YhdT